MLAALWGDTEEFLRPRVHRLLYNSCRGVIKWIFLKWQNKIIRSCIMYVNKFCWMALPQCGYYRNSIHTVFSALKELIVLFLETIIKETVGAWHPSQVREIFLFSSVNDLIFLLKTWWHGCISTMQLGCRHVLYNNCSYCISEPLESSRVKVQLKRSGTSTSFHLHTLRVFQFQTCSLQLQPVLTQVTSIKAIYLFLFFFAALSWSH